MIDAIAAAPGRPTLKATELRHQAGVVQQFNPASVKEGQKLAVAVGFGPFGWFINDAALDELFAGPFPGVAVAGDFGDSIRLECLNEFFDNALWTERGAYFADTV